MIEQESVNFKCIFKIQIELRISFFHLLLIHNTSLARCQNHCIPFIESHQVVIELPAYGNNRPETAILIIYFIMPQL